MKHTTSILPLLLALLFALSGCAKKPTEELSLSVNLSKYPGGTLYLRTYGTTQITTDTIPSGETFRLQYERDTVDLFVLTDTLGRMVLPLIPDSTDLSLSFSPGLKLRGANHTPHLSEWYRLTHERDTLSVELQELLQSDAGNPIGLLEVLGAVERFGLSPDLEVIYYQGLREHSAYLRLLGRQEDIGRPAIFTFPRYLATKDSKGRSRSLPSVIQKDSVLVACILDGSRLAESDTLLLQALDTLTKARYFVLPLADSIPSFWEKHLPKGRTYTVPDSLGAATEEAIRLQTETLPTYLVVDSLGRVNYSGHNQDSLLTYLQSLQPSKDQ